MASDSQRSGPEVFSRGGRRPAADAAGPSPEASGRQAPLAAAGGTLHGPSPAVTPPPQPALARARSIEEALADNFADDTAGGGPAASGSVDADLDAPWALSDQELLATEMARLMAGGKGRRGGGLQEGDRVQGTLVKIRGDEAFVDVGAKAEAVVNSAELKGADGQVEVRIGDRIDAFVVSATPDGIRISRKLALEARSREAVREAYAARMPIEGRITQRNKGGYEVRFQSGQRAFLPLSQIELGHVPDDQLDTFVGRTFRFRITKYEGDGRELVVSRAALLKEERETQADETRATLQVGDVRNGVVRRLADFGAFVDIGGIDGLVPLSELAWSRDVKPQDVLKVGEEIRVKVVRVDADKGRISLSIKQAEGDPWELVGTRYQPGGIYEGRVTRVEAFGAFVELTPGLEGLVHVSRLAWNRVRHPDQVVAPGQAVTVKLVEVDTLKHRLSLSIKDVSGDPWEETTAHWLPGAILTGTVDKVAPFGIFVRLGDAVSGLVPNEELGMDPAQARRTYSQGQEVLVELLSVDRDDRRIRLSMSTGDKRQEREAMRDYTSGRPAVHASDFGTFADLLKGLPTRK